LPVLLRFTDSDYPFEFFKLFVKYSDDGRTLLILTKEISKENVKHKYIYRCAKGKTIHQKCGKSQEEY